MTTCFYLLSANIYIKPGKFYSDYVNKNLFQACILDMVVIPLIWDRMEGLVYFKFILLIWISEGNASNINK